MVRAQAALDLMLVDTVDAVLGVVAKVVRPETKAGKAPTAKAAAAAAAAMLVCTDSQAAMGVEASVVHIRCFFLFFFMVYHLFRSQCGVCLA